VLSVARFFFFPSKKEGATDREVNMLRFTPGWQRLATLCAGCVLAALLLVSATVRSAHAAATGDGIAWFNGSVDAAFAQAKRDNKPIFLYWGAVWCPPCNQVKATIFNRADFIERSRVFIPVYIDGDTPAAQKLGARFKVSGYPTMVLLRPDATEITRLPGEVDAEQYMQVLALGMAATRPVKQLLKTALSARAKPPAKSAAQSTAQGALSAALSDADWRLLAYYSWETDQEAAVPKGQLAPTLARLARACPPSAGDAAARLQLKSLIAAASAAPAAAQQTQSKPAATKTAAAPSLSAADAAAARAQLTKILTDPEAARGLFSVLVDRTAEVLALLTAPGSSERAQLTAAWDAALARFSADPTLSQTDRLFALYARIELAKLAQPDAAAALPPSLLASVRVNVGRAETETTDRYERQSVISAAASTLTEAGLIDESDALLRAELARSHSPYYFMSGLASNAKKRGDAATALDWYNKAYAASQGAATRLQWGASYVRALIELAPQDAARIEAATHALIGELEAKPETFYGRNRTILERTGKRLNDWGTKQRRPDVLKRLRTQFRGVCAQLPAKATERATCKTIL
jgi:thioredoxin-related protein